MHVLLNNGNQGVACHKRTLIVLLRNHFRAVLQHPANSSDDTFSTKKMHKFEIIIVFTIILIIIIIILIMFIIIIIIIIIILIINIIQTPTK